MKLRDLDEPGPDLGRLLARLAKKLAADIEALPDRAARRIHDIRVATKKIQALLRLFEPDLGRKEARKIKRALQKIRRDFSGARDREVMRLWIAKLLPSDPAAIQRLDLDPAGDPPLPDTGRAGHLAKKLLRAVKRLEDRTLSRGSFAERCAEAYGKARKAWQSCLNDSGPSAMHRWRKRVKTAGYHARALRKLPPMDRLARPLDALADRLGDFHDLAVLEERAANEPALLASLQKKKEPLARQCFRSAQSLFQNSPDSFEEELARALR